MERFSKRLEEIIKKPGVGYPALLLLIAYSALLFFRIAPNFLENPGILFARIAHMASLSLDQALQDGISLSSWVRDVRAEQGVLRLVFLVPVSLVYKFLGVSGSTSLILPFGYHFAATIMICKLAFTMSGNWRTGLFAAFIWIAFPATSFYSSAFPLTAPFFFFSTLALYFLLRFAQTRSWIVLIGSIAVLGFLFLPWPGLAFALLVFGAMAFLGERQEDTRVLFSLTVLGVFLLILLVPDMVVTVRSLIDELFRVPGMLIFWLLFFIAYAAYLLKELPKLSYIGSLFFFAFLAIVVYNFFPSPQDLFAENIGGFMVLVLSLPAILLIAQVLSVWLGSWPIPLAGLALTSGIFFAARSDLVFYIQRDLFYADAFISVSRLASGVLVLAILLYTLSLFVAERSFKAQFTSLIILLLPIAAIFPLAAANFENASYYSSYLRAARLAEATAAVQKDLDIYVCSKRLRDRFWYMTGFSSFGVGTKAEGGNPFQKPPTDISNRDSGIAIIDSTCDEIDPLVFDGWIHLFEFGEKDNRLDYYRILPQ